MKHKNILTLLLKIHKFEIEDVSEWNLPIAISPNRDGLIKLGETKDIAAKSIMLPKKVEDLLMKRPEIVKVTNEMQEICDICEL